MINFLVSRERPVSYFATGQQVPEDIEAASRKRLASLLLGQMRRRSEETKETVSIRRRGLVGPERVGRSSGDVPEVDGGFP